MAAQRSLLAVHAHPDDESIFTGGILARYVDEGAHVCLVTCTNGELGEIAEGSVPDAAAAASRLGEIRIGELREACRHLGVADLRLLGYRDSGMAGTPSNQDAEAFVRADLAEVGRRIAAIIEEVRPHVVVTYNERGFYGHPDHIQAHLGTLAALDLTAGWTGKLYYNAMARSRMLEARKRALEAGNAEAQQGGLASQESIDSIGTDDALITSRIDVSSVLDRKVAAISAHRTQLGTTSRLLEMPPETRASMFGTEHYVLARGSTRPEGVEQDLFEGLGV